MAGALAVIGMLATVQSIPASVLPVLWYWAPGALVLALAVAAWGVLDAERSFALPRIRLALGAMALSWWAYVNLFRIIAGHVAKDDYLSYRYPETDAWTVLGPALAFVGLGLVGSALIAFANRAGRSINDAQIAAFATLSLFGIAGLALAPPANSAITLLLATAALVAALAVLVTLLVRVARVLDAQPSLPAATARL